MAVRSMRASLQLSQGLPRRSPQQAEISTSSASSFDPYIPFMYYLRGDYAYLRANVLLDILLSNSVKGQVDL
jgi:hypothetical protein